jgi:NSS family neurotransmitter:Na+ symporter
LLGIGADGGFFSWQGAVIYPILFVAINIFIVVRGVQGGLERFSKIGMPVLFALLVILLIRSITLPGAGEGIMYLLRPDWSAVTG